MRRLTEALACRLLAHTEHSGDLCPCPAVGPGFDYAIGERKVAFGHVAHGVTDGAGILSVRVRCTKRGRVETVEPGLSVGKGPVRVVHGSGALFTSGSRETLAKLHGVDYDRLLGRVVVKEHDLE